MRSVGEWRVVYGEPMSDNKQTRDRKGGGARGKIAVQAIFINIVEICNIYNHNVIIMYYSVGSTYV